MTERFKLSPENKENQLPPPKLSVWQPIYSKSGYLVGKRLIDISTQQIKWKAVKKELER